MQSIPDFIFALLATWLGAVVISRTPRALVARVFGWLTCLITLYGAARVVGALTTSTSVATSAARVEYGVGALLPVALLHIVLALTAGRRPTTIQRRILRFSYGLSAMVGLFLFLTGQRGFRIQIWEYWLVGVPEGIWALFWAGFRGFCMVLAIWWAWRAWRVAESGGARRAQLAAVLLTVIFGAAGGISIIVGSQFNGLQWPGTTLMAISLGLAAYAVIGQRVFLTAEVARRSFFLSLAAGIASLFYVVILIGIDRLSRDLLGIGTPIITALVIVLTLALFDPVRQRLRASLRRWLGPGDVAYDQLLRALGDELLTSQRPEAAIGPALEAICTALDISSVAVVTSDNRVRAHFGVQPLLKAQACLTLPLRTTNDSEDQLLIGPKRNGRAYDAAETALLDDAAHYMGASLQLAERQDREAAALAALSVERTALASRETALSEALTKVEHPENGIAPLSVFALGPLRVEREGVPIKRWGGAKAGTRQAEAMFAFLFDRGERGVVKDEFLEVIWPEVPLEKADLAFHRTLGGLRRILEPELRHGSDATAITFRNNRYRLDPEIVLWSDVRVFEEHLTAAPAEDVEQAIVSLEAARDLYRGDYLDDCPLYGDSPYVEERRVLLRGRYIDVLLALGERYETLTNMTSAAACFREALQLTGDDCPRADDGLARLGLPVL